MNAGVSMATTVNDIEVEQTMLELHKYGVNAGPCGAGKQDVFHLKAVPVLDSCLRNLLSQVYHQV